MSHFSVLVITEDEPTEDVLMRVLEPFGGQEDEEWGRFDWCELGGRWHRALVPKPGAKTFSGEPGVYDVKVHEGGVDALRKRDLDLKPFTTFAVIKDGEWYERDDLGWLDDVVDEKTASKWQATFDRLLAETPDDHWLSIVDCHIIMKANALDIGSWRLDRQTQLFFGRVLSTI